MKTHNVLRKALMVVAVVALAASMALGAAAARVDENILVSTTYNDYYTQLLKAGAKDATKTASVDVMAYLPDQTTAEVKTMTEGGKTGLWTGDNGMVAFKVNVPQTGFYNLQLTYYPVEGKGSSIERMLYIDGVIPFKEARYLSFSRVFKYNIEKVEHSLLSAVDRQLFKKDTSGNEIRAEIVEAPMWMSKMLTDDVGYYSSALRFYLTEGEHVLSFSSVREPMLIGGIELFIEDAVPSYADVKEGYDKKGYAAADGGEVTIQAENPTLISSITLYPVYDKSSANSQPQHITQIRLNSVGGSKWQLNGEWMEWEVDVPADGLYQIVPRARQNVYSGMFASRRIYIDGKIPFEEAKNLRFAYTSGWQTNPLGNADGAYAFYLTEGTHVIRMEAVLGDMADLLRRVEASLTALNGVYRQILMITGPNPDLNRDYSFRSSIPDAVGELGKQSKELYEISALLEEITGEKGEYSVLLDKIAFQTEQMNYDANDIAKNFTSFKTNLGSLGTWIMTAQYQPLELDCVTLQPYGAETPQAEPGFFRSLWFEIQSFFASFFFDYTTVGSTLDADSGDRVVIKVWNATGRDQAQIIREMIDNDFTPNTNIGVDFSLVAAGSLLPATCAGIGPDVNMFSASSDAVNYALRSAVLDISGMPGFDEVASRFHESAMVPLTFNGAVYGLPEQESFPMMFYRKDIFAELGIEPPQTWEDLYELVPLFQQKKMEIGFLGEGGMLTFLYQYGGEFYRNGEGYDYPRFTNIDSEEYINAFETVCEMYTTYKFPLAYDFANRFRTGELPLAFADYTVYNNLIVFATELRGLWEFLPIPGTLMEDGTINRATSATVTTVMMMRGADRSEEVKLGAWEFMKWWTSAPVQSTYGVELEAIMGQAAKYPTANLEALANLPWSADEYTALSQQFQELVGTPEVPGNYIVTRDISFAYKRVVTQGDNPAEALLDYVKDINDELARKRKEFGLD